MKSLPAQSSNLTDVISPAVQKIVERVLPSVVQVRNGGHGGAAGIIWSADGRVLTNYHVVAGKDGPLHVHLRDGRSFEATLVSGNPALDLALLSVQAGDLPAAPIGESSRLRVGELVIAIGHPWGQRDVVTAGIVSGIGDVAVAGTGRKAQYVRSDVRLRPGNSGGPLLNARGEVIGINAMIFGGDMGIAIPVHVARTWVAGLNGRRVTLGVQVQQVEFPPDVRRVLGNGQDAGLLVSAVEPGSLAHRAGLLIGDVLLEVAGEMVEHPDTLRDVLARVGFMGAIRLRVLRADGVKTIDVTLETVERAA